MSLRKLRERALWSQEKLADMSGVSLRTIQRAESGQRVSYASLRALALALRLDVDALERDLYAVQRSEEFIEIPRWVRWLNGRLAGFRSSNRRQALRAERLCIVISMLFAGASLWSLDAWPAADLRNAAVATLVLAYAIAVAIRITDRYRVWPDTGAPPADEPATP